MSAINTFPTQVNLFLACFIRHNWILGWGIHEFFPDDNDVRPDKNDVLHGVGAADNEA
jgi:hypothetical protein